MEYNRSFEQYYDNCKKYGKFAAVLTKQQFAMETNIHTHEDGTKDLIEKTRPDIEIDVWGNAVNEDEKYTNSYAVILGYPGYVQIELPEKEMLSPDQFRVLKEEVLEPIKINNSKVDECGFGEKTELVVFCNGVVKIHFENFTDKIEELISMLEPLVQKPQTIKDEVIIGTPFKEKEKKEEPILEEPIIPEGIDIAKEVDKLIEDMAAGKRDTNGNLIGENQMEHLLGEMYEYRDGIEEDKKRSRGFSTISIIGLVTVTVVVLILVLGVIINTL